MGIHDLSDFNKNKLLIVQKLDSSKPDIIPDDEDNNKTQEENGKF